MRLTAGWSCLLCSVLGAIATLRVMGVGRPNGSPLPSDGNPGLVVIGLLLLSLAAVGFRLILGVNAPGGGRILGVIYGVLGVFFSALSLLAGISFASRSMTAGTVALVAFFGLAVLCFVSAWRRLRGSRRAA